MNHSHAETDYRCLTSCVNSGESSAACLEQCSYETKPPLKDPKNAHKPFSAPKPVDGKLILPPKTAGDGLLGKNYFCQSECLRSGMQYALCEKRCSYQKNQ